MKCLQALTWLDNLTRSDIDMKKFFAIIILIIILGALFYKFYLIDRPELLHKVLFSGIIISILFFFIFPLLVVGLVIYVILKLT